MAQSRVSGHHSRGTAYNFSQKKGNLTFDLEPSLLDGRLTNPVKRPQQAGAAKILNAAEPTIVPTPMSPCVINVPTILMKSSGEEVPTAIIVAPATSGLMCKTIRIQIYCLTAVFESATPYRLPSAMISKDGTKYSSMTTPIISMV